MNSMLTSLCHPVWLLLQTQSMQLLLRKCWLPQSQQWWPQIGLLTQVWRFELNAPHVHAFIYIGFAQVPSASEITVTPVTAEDITTEDLTTDNSTSSLAVWIIVVIGVGGVVIISLIAFVIWWFACKSNSHATDPTKDPTNDPTKDPTHDPAANPAEDLIKNDKCMPIPEQTSMEMGVLQQNQA